MRLISLLLLSMLLMSGCGLPRIPIKQSFHRTASFLRGQSTVHIYQARDPRSLDTSTRILKMEYVPVTMYVVADKRDSVEYMVVAAWQQLLWRFSERLSTTDKNYYAPVATAFARSTDSAVVTWAYPSLDTRDEDLRDITPYRNSYWTVDVFRIASGFDEVFKGDIRSYPQYGPYDPMKRFASGGPYDRAFGDTMLPYAALRQFVESRTGNDAVDSARR